MSWGFSYLLTATSFSPYSKVLQHQEREKGKKEKESLKSPSLFLSEHISSRSCFHSTNVREQAPAVSTENRETHWQFPCWHPRPIRAGEFAVPLHWSTRPLAKSSRCGVRAWKRPCLYLSHTCIQWSCCGHSWSEGEEGHTVETQPLSPTVPSACSIPPCEYLQFKGRITRKLPSEFTSFSQKPHKTENSTQKMSGPNYILKKWTPPSSVPSVFSCWKQGDWRGKRGNPVMVEITHLKQREKGSHAWQ